MVRERSCLRLVYVWIGFNCFHLAAAEAQYDYILHFGVYFKNINVGRMNLGLSLQCTWIGISVVKGSLCFVFFLLLA